MNASRVNAVGLLGGIVAGFMLAVLLGYQAASYSKPSRFVRFHQWINPQSNFFPPFRMLEHLALDSWQPGRTVVLVAGNSIFNGVSQPADEIWTRRLQEILGSDKYVVVNLSFAGAHATEAGMIVAESLFRRGVPFLLVCNTGARAPNAAIGGHYGYYYWEARAQSALLPFADRDADLKEMEAHLPAPEQRKQGELRRAARLNSWFYFQELWHHVGLQHFFTVWTSLIPRNSWGARDLMPDPELPPLPLEQRFRTAVETEMVIVRSYSNADTYPDKEGQWHLKPDIARNISQRIEVSYPRKMRPHMLMVLSQNAPFFRSQLTAQERARDLAMFQESEIIWEKMGIACVISGLDFDDSDFSDRAHLTPTGGHKLAALVAAELHKLHPESPAP